MSRRNLTIGATAAIVFALIFGASPKPAAADPVVMTDEVLYPGAESYEYPTSLRTFYNVKGAIDGVPFHYSRGSHGIVVARQQGVEPKNLVRSNAWWVGCERDAMTDVVLCDIILTIPKYEGDFGKGILLIGDTGLCVIANDFPGRAPMVRVGSNKAMAGSADGPCLSGTAKAKFIEQVRSAAEITIRYTEWPDDYSVDARSTTYGLAQALKMLQWLKEQVKQGRL